MKKIVAIMALMIALLGFSVVVSAGEMVKTKSGLKYEELIIGDGEKAMPNKIATIHFTMFSDVNGVKGEKIFDSVEDKGSPVSFVVGAKNMAKGLNIGVIGMRMGGKRRLFVPANLNPKNKSGKFPGNADLIFEVELLNVDANKKSEEKGEPANMR